MQASRAFSMTWLKQTAPGQLQYKPHVLAKYAINQTIKTSTAATKSSPLTGHKKTVPKSESSADDNSTSENLLDSHEEEIEEIDQTPTTSNVATAEQDQKTPAPYMPPTMTQQPVESPDYQNIQASNSIQESKTSTFDQDDTSSYSTWNKQIKYLTTRQQIHGNKTWKTNSRARSRHLSHPQRTTLWR
jgi:hypothetical protein